ncbi:MAG: ribonuclease H-like domain-containing protein [Deltaproteobacteria bacterium]|nr:ribonuclease H-like domain-containing protein [Deltaproteobacteria bacterium]
MKNYYTHDLSKSDTMSGMGIGFNFDESPDLIIVLSHPTKYRAALKGNQVVGQKSVEFLQQEWQRAWPEEKQEPLSTYWTFLVKNHTTKKKPPIAQVREGLVILMAELKGMLENFDRGKEDDPTIPRILVQGSIPASYLCPGFKSLTEDHGSFFFNPTLQAYVIPTFDFSSMRYQPWNAFIIHRDLERMFGLPDPVAPDYKVMEPEDFFGEEPLTMKGEKVYLDIETTGLSFFADTITLIGYIGEEGEQVKIIEEPSEEMLRILLEEFKRNSNIVVGHNLQFDFGMLQQKTVTGGWDTVDLLDTMFFAYVAGDAPLNLKHLTTTYTNRPGPRSFGSFTDHAYLAEDVLSTRALERYYNPEDLVIPEAVKLLNRVVGHFIRIRHQGVEIDAPLLDELIPEFHAETEKARGYLFDTYVTPEDINFNSSKQVVQFLLANGVPLTTRTASGSLSASEPILQEFASRFPIVKDLLNYRFHAKQATFLASYIEFLQYDGKLHPRMKLHGTDTGRLSCSEPNLQQVPRVGKIKEIFTSRFEGGYFGLIDLDRAELCVAALLADDAKFADALMSDDVHRHVASMIYQKPEEEITKAQRKSSKAITFGLLYGGTDAGLASRAGLSIALVTQVRRDFLSIFTGVDALLHKLTQEAISTKKVVSPFGRIRDLTKIIMKEGKEGAKRKATNTPIQGTASDIMLWIVGRTSEEMQKLGLKSTIIFGVHDSAMLDIHPNEVMSVYQCVNSAFKSLHESPLTQFELWDKLPFTGTLEVARTWAGTESTNEGYDPLYQFPCTSYFTRDTIIERLSDFKVIEDELEEVIEEPISELIPSEENPFSEPW